MPRTQSLPPLESKTAMVRWKRSMLQDLDRVHADMTSLADESRNAPGRLAYLEVMSRAKTAALSLRWRDGAHGYLSEDALAAMLAQLPPFSRKWYRRLDTQARTLNLYGRSLRAALATAEEALSLHQELAQHDP